MIKNVSDNSYVIKSNYRSVTILNTKTCKTLILRFFLNIHKSVSVSVSLESKRVRVFTIALALALTLTLFHVVPLVPLNFDMFEQKSLYNGLIFT